MSSIPYFDQYPVGCPVPCDMSSTPRRNQYPVQHSISRVQYPCAGVLGLTVAKSRQAQVRLVTGSPGAQVEKLGAAPLFHRKSAEPEDRERPIHTEPELKW